MGTFIYFILGIFSKILGYDGLLFTFLYMMGRPVHHNSLQLF